MKKRVRQGDPISVYLLTIFLKQILLYMIKENKFKEGLNIYGYLFLYSVYIYVTTFLFKKREIWDYNQIFPNVKLVVLGH